MTLRTKNEEAKTETTDQKPKTETKKSTAKKEVAKRQDTSTATTSGKTSVFITHPDFLDAVMDAEYGTFISVTANNGTHMTTTKEDLGKVIKFQAIVAKDVWKVTPGSSDEEAKDYFAVSTDGETVSDGRSLQEALDEALDAGYEKASIKKYIDVICIVKECENADYAGETITLQLAPSSQFTWRPLAGKVKMKAAMGKLVAQPVTDDPDHGKAVVFTSTASPTTWKGNDFTKFEFTIED